MIDITPEKYFIDASPSWNGYNHQGKVSLYVVLEKLKDIEVADLLKYELELEWLEDFSIKKEEEYIEIHQVKTLKDTGLAKYKEAIWILLSKTLDFEQVKAGYLHVTQYIKDAQNKEDLKKKFEEYTEPTSSGKDIAKFCCDKVKQSGKFNEVFDKFNLYNYSEHDNYCPIEDIEQKIKNQLKELIGAPGTAQRIDRAYYNLLGLVDRNIIQRHSDDQKKIKGERVGKVTINFTDIHKVVHTNFEIFSEEYASYVLKNEFNAIFNEYLHLLKYEYENKIIDEQDWQRFIDFWEYVNTLNEKDFLFLCLKITPENGVDQDSSEYQVDMLRKCIHSTSMSDGFFEIIKQVKKELSIQEVVYIRRDTEGKNIVYLPSTIIAESHPYKNQQLANSIINNPHPDILNDIDNIITKSINMDSLDDSKIYSDIPDPDSNSDLNTVDESYKITKRKKIRLLDINIAKGELNR